MRIAFGFALLVLGSTPPYASTLSEKITENTQQYLVLTSDKSGIGAFPLSNSAQVFSDPVKASMLLGLDEKNSHSVGQLDVKSLGLPVVPNLNFKKDYSWIKRLAYEKQINSIGQQWQNSVYKVAAPPAFLTLATAFALPVFQSRKNMKRKTKRYRRFPLLHRRFVRGASQIRRQI